MQSLSKKIIVVAMSCVLVSLSGCAIKDTVTDEKKNAVKAEFEKRRDAAYSHIPKERQYSNVKFTDKFFTPPQSENVDYPDWYFQDIELNFRRTSMVELTAILQQQTGIVVRFVDEVDTRRELPISFKGRAGDALEKIAMATGYGYEIEGDLVTWSVFTTTTIPVTMPPSVQSFRIGEEDQESSSNQTSSFGANISALPEEEPSSYSSLQVSDLKAYETFLASIDMLKSGEGLVSYDRASSLLLVKDYPENVKAINKFVKRLNQSSMTNVAFDFTFIEFRNSEGNGAKVDWDLANSFIRSGSENLSGTLTTAFTNSLLTGSAPLSLGLELLDGKWSGSQLLVEALENQGMVSIHQEPRVFTSHNKLSRVELGSDFAYAASSGTNQNQTSTASNLQAGLLSLGIELSVLPTVVHEEDEVYVQLGISLTDLNEIRVFESDESRIQLPETAKKKLTMSFSANSGETILISGNRTSRSELSSSQNGIIPWLFGGSASTDEEYTELIILITPRIINRWG